MALAAAQVIDAIAAKVNALPAYAGRVFTDRAWAVDEAELPVWKVMADGEAVETVTVHWPAVQEHRLEVLLQGHARAVAGLDDALHVMASAALTAVLNAALPLAGLPVQLSLQRIDRDLAAEGDAATGRITLTLLAAFRTLQNAPDTLI